MDGISEMTEEEDLEDRLYQDDDYDEYDDFKK